MSEQVRYGASPGAWTHWDFILGLGEDLLPIVADPSTKLSPASGLKSLGKVPSRLNGRGEAAGFAGWTKHVTTAEEIAAWESDPRLGLCIQTRHVRAIDVDVTDPALAKEIYDEIHATLGLALPARRRSNSSKFLLAFTLSGTFPKRILPTAHGDIEFLGTGNQAVIDSTHPSGVRYAWDGGFPTSIPGLAPEAFEALWAHLVAKFAVGDTSTGKVRSVTTGG